jgi:hypothetical protein
VLGRELSNSSTFDTVLGSPGSLLAKPSRVKVSSHVPFTLPVPGDTCSPLGDQSNGRHADSSTFSVHEISVKKAL